MHARRRRSVITRSFETLFGWHVLYICAHEPACARRPDTRCRGMDAWYFGARTPGKPRRPAADELTVLMRALVGGEEYVYREVVEVPRPAARVRVARTERRLPLGVTLVVQTVRKAVGARAPAPP